MRLQAQYKMSVFSKDIEGLPEDKQEDLIDEIDAEITTGLQAVVERVEELFKHTHGIELDITYE